MQPKCPKVPKTSRPRTFNYTAFLSESIYLYCLPKRQRAYESIRLSIGEHRYPADDSGIASTMADPEENPAENNPQDQAIRDPSREQCHINHPPEPASPESRSSVDIDPLSNRRVADQEEVTERPHLRNGSRRYNNGVASKGKFGMKGMWTPLAIWMSTTVFGTGFMTYSYPDQS